MAMIKRVNRKFDALQSPTKQLVGLGVFVLPMLLFAWYIWLPWFGFVIYKRSKYKDSSFGV